MFRSFSALALGIAIVLATGCAKSKGPTDVPVKGQVNLNGKPLPDGQVVFSVQGLPPSTFDVQNGVFSGKAKEGLNKVEIRSFRNGPPMNTDPDKKPTKVNILPARYNDQTTEKADVKAGGTNDFKFEVKSR